MHVGHLTDVVVADVADVVVAFVAAIAGAVQTQIRLDIISTILFILLFTLENFGMRFGCSTLSPARCVRRTTYDRSRCAVFHFHHQLKLHIRFVFQTFRLTIAASAATARARAHGVCAFWHLFTFSRHRHSSSSSSSNNIFYFAISLYGQASRIRSTITTMYPRLKSDSFDSEILRLLA